MFYAEELQKTKKKKSLGLKTCRLNNEKVINYMLCGKVTKIHLIVTYIIYTYIHIYIYIHTYIYYIYI